VGLLFLTLEIKYFDNTIRGLKLFWMSGFTGLGLAFLVTLILKLTKPSVYYESKRRYMLYFGLFIGLFLTTAALLGFINRRFANPSVVYKTFTLSEKSISSGRSVEYFFYINIDQREERFTVDMNLYDEVEAGQELELSTRKGKLGFDCVTNIRKLERD
jgi:hypothetical protein